MQNHSRIAGASTSTTTPDVYELQGWADLPEGLLHAIVPLLGSITDPLAFAGTCRSWRAAFSSYPSKSKLCTLFPPLLVQPRISVHDPNQPSSNDDGHKLGACRVLNPANMTSSLRAQIPEEASEKLRFAGSSYGQLISHCGRNCLIVDVFTSAEVLSPHLPVTKTYLYCGILTAPLSSPNSHLLVCARPEQGEHFLLLDWLIGSDSWSSLQLNINDSMIVQIVEFNGQFIAMDNYHRLYTLSLAPQLGLQEIAIVWLDNMLVFPYAQRWLVVCSGMLLIVDYYFSSASPGAPVNYKAYRLDMSTEPATWVEVVKLENDALFIGRDVRSPPFSCMSPGRWGGRSNCLYYAHHSQPWVLHGLGDDADAVWDDSNDPTADYNRALCVKLEPFWVYPSMFYLDGQ